MWRLSAVLALCLGTIFGLSWHEASEAYPGPDGYDSGSCYAYTGLKLGVSNWNSGTGQKVAVDVSDNSTKVNMVKVTWDDDNADFTVTTGLARVELYRADRLEDPWLRLLASNGSSCYIHLDGSM